MLPSVLPRLTTDSAVRVFPGVWKPLFLRFPSRDGASSLPHLSPFLSFIFFSYLFLKTMICFSGCLMSSASIQKLLCGIYSMLKCSFDEFVGEKVVSPSYSSTILGPPFQFIFQESEVAQSCPTLWDPIDCSLPGFSIHGIFQVRIPEWVAISFSRRYS